MSTTNDYKVALDALLVEVTSALSDIAVHNATTDDWEIKTAESVEADEDLKADAAEAADESLAELAELENRYTAITRALQKIENGTYGICEISGAPIEPERLAANPAARTCIAHMNEEYELPM